MPCEYCQNPNAKRIGDTYCTDDLSIYEKLSNGAFFYKTRDIESKEHLTRFSLRFVLNGEQYYKIGNKEMRIDPTRYLVVNHLHSYKTAIKARHWENPEALYLAFNPTFLSDAFKYYQSTISELLDNPYGKDLPVEFFEQTYELDPILEKYVGIIYKAISSSENPENINLDNIYSLVLERIFQIHFNIYSNINRLPPIKFSTKLELYKRINIAREYMEMNLESKINLDEVSKIASLSKFHFLRLFKETYGKTPHQYILSRKLMKSKRLLTNTNLTIQQISNISGFREHAAFTNLFRKKTGMSPKKQRKKGDE